MNVLYKNATNRHELCFREPPACFRDILISYKQNGRIVMRRTKKELRFEERCGHWVASWELSPAETLRFAEKQPVFMQALKLRRDGGQEPGEIVELDVIEALEHGARGGTEYEPCAWPRPL